MHLNFITVSLLGLLLLILFIGWNVIQKSAIPREWRPNLTLRYNTSHAMSGDLADYYFTADSEYVHNRKITKDPHLQVT